MAKYRRTKFVVNPKFQLKLALSITAIALVTNFFYFWVIDGLLEGVHNLLVELPAPTDTIEKFGEEQASVVSDIYIYQSLVCLVMFFGCLLFTHRIAGPMYKLRLYLRQFCEGTAARKLRFRKGDCFQEVADEINMTFDKLSADNPGNLAALNAINADLRGLIRTLPEDKRKDFEEIAKRLAAAQSPSS